MEEFMGFIRGAWNGEVWLEWVDTLLTMMWEPPVDGEFDEFRSEWVRVLLEGGKAAGLSGYERR
jgi:hypothetical protein